MIPLSVHDDRFHEVVGNPEALEQLGSGFLFTEGPIWDHRNNNLIFSDIPGDQMYRWTGTGEIHSFRRPSNKANGNTFDRLGRILTCEHATSRVTRASPNGRIDVLASHHKGKELNSPNDIIVSRDHRIFFSDPSYGRLDYFGVEREQELDFHGVFAVGPDAQSPILLASDFDQPNGLCLSPDEKYLYVDDSERGHIRRFEFSQNETLAGGDVWAELTKAGEGAPDGLKCDSAGNVYCAGPGGIHVFAPDATCLGIVHIPEVIANFTWGGPNMRTIFATASTSLYRFATRIPGPRLF